MTPNIVSPLDPGLLERERERLLTFGRAFPSPYGGAAWLDESGQPDLSRPVHTWITARMAHVYCLAHLIGDPGADALADQALAGLTGGLRDGRSGGWFSSVGDGQIPDEKSCYAHAFVVLAASSATVAERPGARSLLDEALAVWNSRFWDAGAALYVDSWDRSFTVLDPYRGMNCNMHAVEALLAATDATGDPQWRDRALEVARRVAGFAGEHDWRIPEHFDSQWQPLLQHNRSRPDDPFRPFGATVGHGLEWARLLLQLEASLERAGTEWLGSAAIALFDRAVGDGWAVDGADGFVYTTDWNGTPVVRDRMHWVLAEAISAAAALYARTGDDRYAACCRTWWRYADQHLLDYEHGSWHHQLDAQNRPIATVWPGKPDLYHAVQATLIPRLPLAPGLALALRSRLLAPGG